MNKILYVLVGTLSVAVIGLCSPAKQCPGLNFADLQERINVDPCGVDKCKMPKKQNTTVTFKFKPDFDVKTITNMVFAVVIGIPFPFLGVDGTSACDHIIHAADGTSAPCPLKANTEYIYKNAFYIEPLYPEVNLKVHWSLKDGNKEVMCFEIPASIEKPKKRKPIIL